MTFGMFDNKKKTKRNTLQAFMNIYSEYSIELTCDIQGRNVKAL